jgi:prepilin peptidase CpaA
MLLIPLILVVLATLHDLRGREIPDWISVSLVVWGALATALGYSGLSWLQLALGMSLGFAVALPFYAAGGFGGGDLKLVVGLGGVLGPWALLSTLCWVAIAGGALALLAKARGQRDLAYVPAIATGLFVYMLRTEAFAHVLAY